jgi:hypothetical protein
MCGSYEVRIALDREKGEVPIRCGQCWWQREG